MFFICFLLCAFYSTHSSFFPAGNIDRNSWIEKKKNEFAHNYRDGKYSQCNEETVIVNDPIRLSCCWFSKEGEKTCFDCKSIADHSIDLSSLSIQLKFWVYAQFSEHRNDLLNYNGNYYKIESTICHTTEIHTLAISTKVNEIKGFNAHP